MSILQKNSFSFSFFCSKTSWHEPLDVQGEIWEKECEIAPHPSGIRRKDSPVPSLGSTACHRQAANTETVYRFVFLWKRSPTWKKERKGEKTSYIPFGDDAVLVKAPIVLPAVLARYDGQIGRQPVGVIFRDGKQELIGGVEHFALAVSGGVVRRVMRNEQLPLFHIRNCKKGSSNEQHL